MGDPPFRTVFQLTSYLSCDIHCRRRGVESGLRSWPVRRSRFWSWSCACGMRARSVGALPLIPVQRSAPDVMRLWLTGRWQITIIPTSNEEHQMLSRLWLTGRWMVTAVALIALNLAGAVSRPTPDGYNLQLKRYSPGPGLAPDHMLDYRELFAATPRLLNLGIDDVVAHRFRNGCLRRADAAGSILVNRTTARHLATINASAARIPRSALRQSTTEPTAASSPMRADRGRCYLGRTGSGRRRSRSWKCTGPSSPARRSRFWYSYSCGARSAGDGKIHQIPPK